MPSWGLLLCRARRRNGFVLSSRRWRVSGLAIVGMETPDTTSHVKASCSQNPMIDRTDLDHAMPRAREKTRRFVLEEEHPGPGELL